MPEEIGSAEQADSKTIEMTEGLDAWTVTQVSLHCYSIIFILLAQNLWQTFLWSRNYEGLPTLSWQSLGLASFTSCLSVARAAHCQQLRQGQFLQCSSSFLKQNEGAARSWHVSLSKSKQANRQTNLLSIKQLQMPYSVGLWDFEYHLSVVYPNRQTLLVSNYLLSVQPRKHISVINYTSISHHVWLTNY